MKNLIGIILLAVALSGCAAQKTVTNLPPGVTMTQAQTWDSAVSNLDKIATANSAARQTIVELNHANLFPDGPNYITALNVVGKIDQLELAASAVLKQSPSNFTDTTRQQVRDYTTQIAAQLVLLNNTGVTGIKNPSKQTQIADLISSITAAVGLVLTL